MFIVCITWNHVPVKMRHDVAETCQIDLIRTHDLADRRFHQPHGRHQLLAFYRRQIRHLGNMRIPYDAAETRIVLIGNQHDAQTLVAENDFASGLLAQFAGRCHGAYTSTRSMPPAFAFAT